MAGLERTATVPRFRFLVALIPLMCGFTWGF